MKKVICKSCGIEFEITPDDQAFYEKIGTMFPTWCSDCQLQRRLSFRNERNLYKRKCDAPGHAEEIISIYSPDSIRTVYDSNYWWSDSWDPIDYGMEFNESVSFMNQIGELMKKVPNQSLLNFNAVNSDYCNYTTDNKNCYLVFGGDFNEDVMYSGFPMKCKQSADLYWVFNSDLCYEMTDAEKCFNVRYSNRVGSCTDSMFLYNCSNLSNCFGCVNLKNKSYCIFNEQYTKEEYNKKIKELNPYSYSSLLNLKKQFSDFKLKFPRRFAHNIQANNSTGDNLYQVNDCQKCFDIAGPAEHLKNVFLGGWGLTDARNSNHMGHSTELAYNSYALFSGCSKIVASYLISSSSNVTYSYNCRGCSNIFGCVGLRNKSYCILNKQYSKEEYEILIEKIKTQMVNMPYKDINGNEYMYGDFFAPEFSPFGYNETVSQEYFPLNEDNAKSRGFNWQKTIVKDYKVSISGNSLPDSILETGDEILKEIIGCQDGGTCDENCTTAFRITKSELEFYRRINVPIPRLCPNCRNTKLLRSRYPLNLLHRKCQCNGQKSENGVYINTSSSHQSHSNSENCPNEFDTTYSLDKKEIVYCEECYKSEVS